MRFTEMNSPRRQPKVFYGKRQFWQSDKYLWLSEEKDYAIHKIKYCFTLLHFQLLCIFG